MLTPDSSTRVAGILDAAMDGARLSADDALFLWQRAGLHELARAAHAMRLVRARPDVVTYVVDRNINYTNVCTCGCRFCAFFRPPGHAEGYVLEFAELDRKIEETVALAGTQVLLQGGHHPELGLKFFTALLERVKSHPVHAHAFSPPEIVYLARLEDLSVAEVIARLIDAGLDSIPGGGAEILVDRVRSSTSPNKCGAAAWLDVMRQAHRQGLKTTATMMFGHIETVEERIEHLVRVRELQDETHGFTAFIPWAFQPDNTALAAEVARLGRAKATAPEYLRMVALSRLMLDNVPNIQVSWVTMGAKPAQLALFFGGNDFGSTMIEENVVKAAGVGFRLGEAEMRELISDAGFTPARRRMDYTLREETA